MKKFFVVFVVIAGLFCSKVTFAVGECDKYKSPYDKTYCFAKLFIESDNELNEVYRELMNNINRDEIKKKLIETQRQWIEFRNKTCEKTSGTIDVQCSYKVNKERTEFLRDRLRECKTGNCRNEEIYKKSWK